MSNGKIPGVARSVWCAQMVASSACYHRDKTDAWARMTTLNGLGANRFAKVRARGNLFRIDTSTFPGVERLVDASFRDRA